MPLFFHILSQGLRPLNKGRQFQVDSVFDFFQTFLCRLCENAFAVDHGIRFVLACAAEIQAFIFDDGHLGIFRFEDLFNIDGVNEAVVADFHNNNSDLDHFLIPVKKPILALVHLV